MIFYDDMWVEGQAPDEGETLFLSVDVAVRNGLGYAFTAKLKDIGTLRFEYVATLRGRSVYRAKLQDPGSGEPHDAPDPEQLAWSGERNGAGAPAGAGTQVPPSAVSLYDSVT